MLAAAPRPPPRVVGPPFWISPILVGVYPDRVVVLIHISLRTEDVGHLFTRLPAVRPPSCGGVGVSVKVFGPFFSWVVSFPVAEF